MEALWNSILFDHTRRLRMHVQSCATQQRCFSLSYQFPTIGSMHHDMMHDHLSLLKHIRWELTHVLIISLGHFKHSSICILLSIRLSSVHATPFTTYFLDSGCMIQPSTHGSGRNIGTPMPSLTFLFLSSTIENVIYFKIKIDHYLTHKS